MLRKRICIIGAGASGLAAIKCCIDEKLEPLCFERSHDIGGLWRYEEGPKSGATVYESTYINTSKELMCFSDFPINAEWPNFMHHSKIMEYYRSYAEKFELLQYISFLTEVLSCQPCSGSEGEDKWSVKIRNIQTMEENIIVVDGILVAVGHHAESYFPLDQFPGVKEFHGKILHSKEYRNFKGFEKKNVLIVGMGNSGTDIAVELSWHAKQVYLSTRRGAWVFNRVGPQGVPVDFVGVTRYQAFLSRVLPEKWTRNFLEKMLTARFDHAHYGLKPSFGPFNQHPLMNDDLPNRILNGSIKIKCNVSKFSHDTAYFEDETEEKIDAIIFATGFKHSFPFVEDSIIEVKDGTKSKLYKYMWPLTLKNPNLAVIGHIQALGAVNPISEMQCRWATRVFKGLQQLPSRVEMERDVDKKIRRMKERFYASQRHTLEVDHVDYMDELADQIGVKPNMTKLFLFDPKLAYKVFFEINSPYQYRLSGPGAWDKAREMIMTQKKRVFCPLHTRPLPKSVLKKKSRRKNRYFMFIVLIVAFAIPYFYGQYM